MILKMSDICSKIGSGATPKGGKNAYIDEGISLIRSQNILDFSFSHDGLVFINEEQARKLDGVTVEEDDVLLNITGDSVARACIVDNSVLPARVNQHVCILRASKDKVLSSYILYYLQMKKTELLQMASSGATRNALTKGMIEELELDLPSIEEQKKIIFLIDSIQEKLKTNEKINRNLEEQAKSIFKERFIDFNSFDGVMPSDWRVLTLEDVSELSAGGDKPNKVSSTPTVDLNIPIYSNGISNEGLYGFTDVAKILEESVTVSARGTIGYVCLRQTPYLPIVRLVSLVPKCEVISAKYLYHWLESLHISGTGTTQLQLTVPDFKKTKIVIPTKELMDDFTEIVTPMYDKILRNKLQNSRLSEIRDTLLPKLMTGDLDVSELFI